MKTASCKKISTGEETGFFLPGDVEMQDNMFLCLSAAELCLQSMTEDIKPPSQHTHTDTTHRPYFFITLWEYLCHYCTVLTLFMFGYQRISISTLNIFHTKTRFSAFFSLLWALLYCHRAEVSLCSN